MYYGWITMQLYVNAVAAHRRAEHRNPNTQDPSGGTVPTHHALVIEPGTKTLTKEQQSALYHAGIGKRQSKSTPAKPSRTRTRKARKRR